MNIAILGATSHIAKGLIERFLNLGAHHLHLFSRSQDRVRQFLAASGASDSADCTVHAGYQSFAAQRHDVIINCIGVETRNKHNCDFTRYFSVTEEFDALVLSYLQEIKPDALYISFSSGAVYGKGFSAPAAAASVNAVRVNQLAPEDFYGIARINAEAKHRAHGNLRIVDLRIFSYFSRYITLTDGYFITDVMEAILGDKLLVTDTSDMVRDYLHPDDLFAMILSCIRAGKLNRALDVNSKAPVSKQEILDYFAAQYGLKYERRQFSENASATGAKSNYFSTCNQACQMGYAPQFSSMDGLKDVAGDILNVIDGRKRS